MGCAPEPYGIPEEEAEPCGAVAPEVVEAGDREDEALPPEADEVPEVPPL